MSPELPPVTCWLLTARAQDHLPHQVAALCTVEPTGSDDDVDAELELMSVSLTTGVAAAMGSRVLAHLQRDRAPQPRRLKLPGRPGSKPWRAALARSRSRALRGEVQEVRILGGRHIGDGEPRQ